MTSIGKKTLLWLPRILSISLATFISLFAFDVFSEGGSVFKMMVGFFIHLIPALIIIFSLILAWRFRLLGGILFIAIGLAFTFFFNTYKNVGSFILLTLSLFLVGVLFIIDSSKAVQ